MYNFALRLNLTSHEKGRTTRSQARLPVLRPIAFPGLDWDAHPSIQLLAGTAPSPLSRQLHVNKNAVLTFFSRHHKHAGP